MPVEVLFSITSQLALLGWILIAISYWKPLDQFVYGIIIILLAAVYAGLIFFNFSFSAIQRFSTLEGIRKLFAKDELLLAGWVHYLAFDLLAGLFILHHTKKHHLPFLVLLPCLLLTFMLGPAGLLLFTIIRTIKTKHYFINTF